ncbi:MAG: hypothetical protein Q9168_004040 [Polycauliona sp. 1 TL-2023]
MRQPLLSSRPHDHELQGNSRTLKIQVVSGVQTKPTKTYKCEQQQQPHELHRRLSQKSGMPAVHSKGGQDLSSTTPSHPIKALPSFTDLLVSIKELPPNSSQWPSEMQPGYIGSMPPPPRPSRNSAIPAALRPGNPIQDTRTRAEEMNLDFEPTNRGAPAKHNQPILQRTPEEDARVKALGPYLQGSAMHAGPGGIAFRPQVTILARPKQSSDISAPLPNSSGMDFPMTVVWRGKRVTLNGPWWDEGRKQPLSGDNCYLDREEREKRRMLRREAREDMRRYRAPDWLVEENWREMMFGE